VRGFVKGIDIIDAMGATGREGDGRAVVKARKTSMINCGADRGARHRGSRLPLGRISFFPHFRVARDAVQFLDTDY